MCGHRAITGQSSVSLHPSPILCSYSHVKNANPMLTCTRLTVRNKDISIGVCIGCSDSSLSISIQDHIQSRGFLPSSSHCWHCCRVPCRNKGQVWHGVVAQMWQRPAKLILFLILLIFFVLVALQTPLQNPHQDRTRARMRVWWCLVACMACPALHALSLGSCRSERHAPSNF